jgi:hypothetical protein
MKADGQGTMLHDPCDGTGLLSLDVNGRSVAARCMCEKGQLRMSATIPLVVDIGLFTEQLQELYPDGIPDVIPREHVTDTPVGPKRRNRHRINEDAYRREAQARKLED